jgi:hypothetical protein
MTNGFRDGMFSSVVAAAWPIRRLMPPFTAHPELKSVSDGRRGIFQTAFGVVLKFRRRAI